MEEEFKFGEIVLVSNNGVNWDKRYFLGKHKGKIYCVNSDFNNDFSSFINEEKMVMDSFGIIRWIHIKKLPQIEISVKINGIESKLSDISEETLLKIRKGN